MPHCTTVKGGNQAGSRSMNVQGRGSLLKRSDYKKREACLKEI